MYAKQYNVLFLLHFCKKTNRNIKNIEKNCNKIYIFIWMYVKNEIFSYESFEV